MSVKRFVSVVVMFAVLVAAAPVMADNAYYWCSIDEMGIILPCTSMPNGGYFLKLTDINGSFSNVSFVILDSEYKDPVLSVALTALSTDRNVYIYGDPFAVDASTRLSQIRIRPCVYSTPCE